MFSDEEFDFECKRLVVSKRGKTTYHYWRDTPNVNKRDIFYIRLGKENYILKDGKLIDTWDKCLDAIDAKILEVSRNKTIEKILDGRG